jgi:hypothetical protein
LRLRLGLRPWGVGVHGVRMVRGVVLRGLLRRRVLLLHHRVLIVGRRTLWRHREAEAVLGAGGAAMLHRQLLSRRRVESPWATWCAH